MAFHFFPSSGNFPRSLPICLSGRARAWGVNADALEETGEGRNRSPLADSGDSAEFRGKASCSYSNALRVGAGSGGFYQCSEGGSYFALGQNCRNLNRNRLSIRGRKAGAGSQAARIRIL